MVNTKLASLARIAPALVLFSCVPQKAVVVEAAPVVKKEKPAEASVPEPLMPGLPDDGIRLPSDLEAMPDESAFSATVPTGPSTHPGSGAVTVRPPTDPPPRPKPKEGE